MACEVCGSPSALFQDHCHKSGQFRGKLCNSCNVLLSISNDSPEELCDKAAKLRIGTLPSGKDTLHFRLRETLFAHNQARADILEALAEYLLRY